MATAQLNVRISEEEHRILEDLASQTDGILTKAGVIRVLIRQAKVIGFNPLTGAPVTQTMGEPAARRASSSSSSSNTSNKSISMSIPAELEPQSELIREFWKTKKGSRGQVAWKLLIGELEKIRAAYGLPVVAEQLELAINGKWQGVTLKNYEQFKPKAAAKEPEHRHPASRVFTAAKGFDDGPTANPALNELF
jgi:hypothetical protein